MAEVTQVEVDRERAVTLTFADGRVCRFALDELRRACPCASCRGQRDRGEAAWPRPGSVEPLRITGAELVGSWGISFTWNDGHTDGIYAWELLGSLVPVRAGLGEHRSVTTAAVPVTRSGTTRT